MIEASSKRRQRDSTYTYLPTRTLTFDAHAGDCLLVIVMWLGKVIQKIEVEHGFAFKEVTLTRLEKSIYSSTFTSPQHFTPAASELFCTWEILSDIKDYWTRYGCEAEFQS